MKNLIVAFNFGVHSQGKMYIRQVYSVLDFMGNVGGFADAAILIGMLFNFYFAASISQVKLVQLY